MSNAIHTPLDHSVLLVKNKKLENVAISIHFNLKGVRRCASPYGLILAK